MNSSTRMWSHDQQRTQSEYINHGRRGWFQRYLCRLVIFILFRARVLANLTDGNMLTPEYRSIWEPMWWQKKKRNPPREQDHRKALQTGCCHFSFNGANLHYEKLSLDLFWNVLFLWFLSGFTNFYLQWTSEIIIYSWSVSLTEWYRYLHHAFVSRFEETDSHSPRVVSLPHISPSEPPLGRFLALSYGFVLLICCNLLMVKTLSRRMSLITKEHSETFPVILISSECVYVYASQYTQWQCSHADVKPNVYSVHQISLVC